MTDKAIYVRFTRTEDGGTRLWASRGYNGPVIANLVWGRVLTPHEERELDVAVRLGGMVDAIS